MTFKMKKKNNGASVPVPIHKPANKMIKTKKKCNNILAHNGDALCTQQHKMAE